MDAPKNNVGQRRIDATNPPKVEFGNIPDELKAMPQWVCWQMNARDGRPTKVPIEPSTRRFAKANDPSTWDTYEAACDTLKRHPNLSGIGFVFTAEDPYAGVDIDRCLDADGAFVWGADTVSALATYTEVSPSGSGVKAFLRASKRGVSNCRKDGFGPSGDGEVEVYDQNRFFAVTGRTLPDTSREIADGQDALDALCDRLWGDNAADKPNAEESQQPERSKAFNECLANLMAMDLIDHKDGSHRLFAACCRCVEYNLSDREALKCISAYHWKRPFPMLLNNDAVLRRLRDAERKADRGSKIPAEPFSFKPIGQLIADHPELRKPVIHGLLREGETMNVIASPKVGKSWLVTDLALSVATGQPWLDGYACERGDVLIVDNELHSETTANRIPKVMNARGIDLADVADRIFVANVRGRLQDIQSLAADFVSIEPGRFKLIVLDAFYRFMPKNTDENDNAAMAGVYNLIDSVASRLRCCFVLVHHSSKGNQSGKRVTDVGAGAGSQSRATDTHLILRQHEQPDAIVLDAAVRSWPPIEPRCLRFAFPTFMPADELDPLDLKPERPRRKKQREAPETPSTDPEELAEQFACDFVTPEPQTMAAILDAAVETGMARRAAERLLKRAERDKRVHRWSRDVNRHVRFASEPQSEPDETAST